MNEVQHTPGPWEAHGDDKEGWIIWAGESAVAEIRCPYTPSMDRYEGDAKLIAAAPEMFAALVGILEAENFGHDMVQAHNKARTAIAKAKPLTSNTEENW